MKNQEVSRKLLRAISIGLAATLTLMPTATVFAENEDNTSGSTSDTSDNSGSEDKHEDHKESSEVKKDSEDVKEKEREESHHDSDHDSDNNSDSSSDSDSNSDSNNGFGDSGNNDSVQDNTTEINSQNNTNNQENDTTTAEPTPAYDSQIVPNITPNADNTPVGNLLSDAADALYLAEAQKAAADAANITAGEANAAYVNSVNEANAALNLDIPADPTKEPSTLALALDNANTNVNKAGSVADQNREDAQAVKLLPEQLAAPIPAKKPQIMQEITPSRR